MPSRMSRRFAGFLVLSLGAHAVAFSLFRDPGEFFPIPPHGSGQVTLMRPEDSQGMASLFEPSAIVMPQDQPERLAGGVTLPWEGGDWPSQTTLPAPMYRPTQLGQTSSPKASVPLFLPRFSEKEAKTPRAVPASWYELGGDLKNRKASKPIQLPTMKSANALDPTVARLGVDEDGAVRFVCLEGSSGDPAVDREASSLLRTWRFEPNPKSSIEWGRVRILWAIEAAGEPKP